MNKQVINTAHAPAAVGPYSQAIVSNGWLYVSGQLPLDPVTGVLSEGDIQAQARQVLDNLQAILNAAGADFANVVKTNIYLTDMADFAVVNKVYAGYFTIDPPARACLGVAALPKGAGIEMDLVAVLR